jgi:hypothetical protein
MAEKIVSPGVFTRENDLSFLSQGASSIGMAFIGPFKEGPLVPTVVNTQVEFEQLYGTVDDTYYTPIAVSKYLKEAGQAVIARVAYYGGYTEKSPIMITGTSGSVSGAFAILYNTDTETTSAFDSTLFTFTNKGTGSFVLSGSSFPNPLTGSLNKSLSNNVASLLGTDPLGPKEAYTYAYFGNNAYSKFGAIGFTGVATTKVDLPNQIFPDAAQEAQTPYVQSQTISGKKYNVFKFETIGGGNSANTKIKIGITSIKAAGTAIGTDYSTFTVVVRSFSDTNRRKQAVESYSNVTLDPNSANYIYRVIGDRKIKFEGTRVTETGDWANRSKYIRLVNTQDDPTLSPQKIPQQCMPAGHAAYYTLASGSAADINKIPDVTYVTPSATTYGGIDLDGNTDNVNFMRAYPLLTVSGAAVDNRTGITGSNVPFNLDNGYGLDLTSADDTEISKRNFLIGFQGGFDGQSPTIPNLKGVKEEITNTQGFDCSTLTTSGSIAYIKQIDALSNSEEYDIQTLITPGINATDHTALVQYGLNMIADRGDCFYIIDPTKISGTISEAKTAAKNFDTSYAAMYFPWIKTTDPITGKLITIPPSTLMPATYAANDRVAAEWFAPAGLNRGGLGGAVAVLEKLNQADRDNLYEEKVNPIIIFPGQGVVAFGQKTLQAKPSALDRINVRRLLLTVRKYIASTSRYLVFEQNTSTTRNRFLNIVTPYLETIQQKQGLYAFKVIMDESNNTPDMIDRNFLKGEIYLQPTKTAEFIQIDFNILPTGATFGG